MGTRYRPITLDQFRAAMADIGFTEAHASGSEHLFERAVQHFGVRAGRYAVRIWSSVHRASGVTRENGEDAIRILLVDHHGDRQRIVTDWRAFRTANALATTRERARGRMALHPAERLPVLRLDAGRTEGSPGELHGLHGLSCLQCDPPHPHRGSPEGSVSQNLEEVARVHGERAAHALRLRSVDGLRLHEIGARIGVSKQAVSKMLRRVEEGCKGRIGRPRIAPEAVARIYDLSCAGHSPLTVSRRLGISDGTVVNYLYRAKREGIMLRQIMLQGFDRAEPDLMPWETDIPRARHDHVLSLLGLTEWPDRDARYTITPEQAASLIDNPLPEGNRAWDLLVQRLIIRRSIGAKA